VARNAKAQRGGSTVSRYQPPVVAILTTLLTVVFVAGAEAHGVSGKDAVFLQGIRGRAIGPLMYLGAKHMVTGYDHLLFLVGIVFFLRRLTDIVRYVSLFTIGHSVTLLAGVLGGVRANPYLIDAIIGFSVVYKAFDNVDGFRSLFQWRPDPRIAVLLFGLFHGFGLATRLQDFSLAPNGLVANIVSFNVGVEIGQGFALAGILIGLTYWRTRSGFRRHAFAANVVLMACGFLLVGYQLSGYVLAGA
jgi:HupE / UreJ protein